jgi:hypothetical protein
MKDSKRQKTEEPGSDVAALCERRPLEEKTRRSQTAATTTAIASGRNARPISDVAKLPPELRELVDRLLVEGATFEDVCESVNERGVPLTLQAVQNCYRSDLKLQKRRIEFQAERARVLTEALGDPDSSDAQLAYAAMLTGLQSLTRKDGGITLKDAVKGTMERRNILLKRDLLRMRIAREEEDKRFRKTRLHAEFLKLQLTKTKLAQLQRELKKHENSSTLGQVAMEKIQEIYGLLQIPVIPRDVEACGEEKKL